MALGRGRKGSLLNELEILQSKAERDIAFRSTPAYELADFFRQTLKRNSYTMTTATWDKTVKYAKEIIEEHSHISIEEWKRCILWALSDRRKVDAFWAKVPIMHLGTIIKIYNTYRNHTASDTQQKRSIEYGSHRDSK